MFDIKREISLEFCTWSFSAV